MLVVTEYEAQFRSYARAENACYAGGSFSALNLPIALARLPTTTFYTRLVISSTVFASLT